MKRFLIFLLALLPLPVLAQKVTISGYITDAKTGETLIGAGLVENQSGAVSNSYGFFSLTLPVGRHTLTCSYVGYSDNILEIVLQRDTTVNFSLQPGSQLEEASIVASGDVGIRSTKMSSIELSNLAIRNTPSLFGEHDILKTVQLLPGVQAGNEGFSGVYVRGGGPEENLLLLDGIPLYNADHLLGIMSVFQPEAVKKVTLFKGSFPARFGGRISSIIDVRTNDGDFKETHGTVGISLLSDKLHLEGPIIRDKLSYSLSGRVLHSFLFEPFIRLLARTPANYYFYDANAKLSWRLSDTDRLYASFYTGRDVFNYKAIGEDGIFSKKHSDRMGIHWGNTLFGIRWNHVFSNKLFSNTTLSFTRYNMLMSRDMVTYDYSGTSSSQSLYRMEYNSGMRDLTAKTDYDYSLSPNNIIKFGAEYVYHAFVPETSGEYVSLPTGEEADDTSSANSSGETLPGHELSIYAEDEISLGDHLVMNPGLRLAFFYTQGTPYYSLEPRISTKYDFTDGYSIKAAYSRMSQYVHLLSSANFALPLDLWVPITDKIKPVKSDQVSVGVYYTGLMGWEFSLEGYYKWMHNVLEYKDGTAFLGNNSNWQTNVEMGEGMARGIELFVEKKTGKTTGWLGYTLSWSDRIFPDGSINHGERYPYRYDRRHNLSVVVNHRFNESWLLSGTWTFASGGAVTLMERQTVTITPDGKVIQQKYTSHRNNYRLPPSHRLNLGLKWIRTKKRGTAEWDFSIYNVYNQMNPNFVFAQMGYVFDENHKVVSKDKIVLKKVTLLPLIPSIGWTRKF